MLRRSFFAFCAAPFVAAPAAALSILPERRTFALGFRFDGRTDFDEAVEHLFRSLGYTAEAKRLRFRDVHVKTDYGERMFVMTAHESFPWEPATFPPERANPCRPT